MATVRITEAEAARDFLAVLARARAGEEVVIENEAHPPVVLHSLPRPRRLLSESLRIAEDSRSTATLDGGFGRDVEEFINSHREPLDFTWD
jgi:antitoxin (DNA-binding transcriptional repressor) of toxin-antitoxin stability system